MSSIASQSFDDHRERQLAVAESSRFTRTKAESNRAVFFVSCAIGLVLAGGVYAQKKAAENGGSQTRQAVVVQFQEPLR